MKFSIFKNFILKDQEKDLYEIFEAISEGKFADEIGQIRQAYAEGNEYRASELKKALPSFAPSARFQGERKTECITEYTGMIVLDFDNIEEPDMLDALEAVRKSPFTTMAFASPSGRGFKVLVRVDSDMGHHQSAFLTVSKYYEELTGCTADALDNDPTQLCFVSHDPEAYINMKAETFHVERTGQPSSSSDGSSNGEYGSDVYDRLKLFTDNKSTNQQGNRDNYIYLVACNANRWGIAEADIQKWVVNDPGFSDLGSDERFDIIRGVYQDNKEEHGKLDNSADSADSADHVFSTAGEMTLSNMPYLPDEIFETMPKFIKDILEHYRDRRERDVVLLTLLTAIGPCFPNVKTMYRGKENYLTLLFMLGAPAAVGKSFLGDAGSVVTPLHTRLMQQTKSAMKEYRRLLAKSKKDKEEVPEKPPFKCLRVPGNTSSAQILSLLKDNDGVGYMNETEADTLVNALKQDWGDFSDVLRKAFHHEPVLYTRKTGSEYIEIPLLRLSMALSGTLDQLARLFQSAENGLVSRFMFYAFDTGSYWKPNDEELLTKNFSEIYQQAGVHLMNLADACEGKDVQIEIRKHHTDEIDDYFSDQLEKIHLFHEGAESIAKRYALMVVRIAALFTWLNKVESISDNAEPVSDRYTCCDIQFNNAMKIIKSLLPHAILVSQSLPNKNRNAFITSPDRWEWFNTLPKNFTRAEAVKHAAERSITEDVVDKLIKKLHTAGKLEKVRHGSYQKI